MVDQKQLENVEYFNHLVRMVNDATYTHEIKSSIQQEEGFSAANFT
jgi:hypothetical protein